MKNAAICSKQMLMRIEKLYKEGYYNECPDVVSYKSVLNSWEKTKQRGAAYCAELLLKHLKETYESKRISYLKPNNFLHNTVIITR